MIQGTQTGLCDNLEGWHGMRGGKEVQEGGGIRVPIADSHCCMAESNNAVKQLSCN